MIGTRCSLRWVRALEFYPATLLLYMRTNGSSRRNPVAPIFIIPLSLAHSAAKKRNCNTFIQRELLQVKHSTRKRSQAECDQRKIPRYRNFPKISRFRAGPRVGTQIILVTLQRSVRASRITTSTFPPMSDPICDFSSRRAGGSVLPSPYTNPPSR